MNTILLKKDMNRIDQLFKKKGKNILSIYFTAGYPNRDDTVEVIETLEARGGYPGDWRAVQRSHGRRPGDPGIRDACLGERDECEAPLRTVGRNPGTGVDPPRLDGVPEPDIEVWFRTLLRERGPMRSRRTDHPRPSLRGV